MSDPKKTLMAIHSRHENDNKKTMEFMKKIDAPRDIVAGMSARLSDYYMGYEKALSSCIAAYEEIKLGKDPKQIIQAVWDRHNADAAAMKKMLEQVNAPLEQVSDTAARFARMFLGYERGVAAFLGCIEEVKK